MLRIEKILQVNFSNFICSTTVEKFIDSSSIGSELDGTKSVFLSHFDILTQNHFRDDYSCIWTFIEYSQGIIDFKFIYIV